MSNYPAYIERMADEHAQLKTKINSLIDFMSTEKYELLSNTQKSFLCDQAIVMSQYAEILDTRIVLEKQIHDRK